MESGTGVPVGMPRQYTAVVLVTEGLFAVAALVLVVGGISKLRDPVPTRRMLALLRVPGPDVVTHLSAGVEVALGVIALLFGGRVTAGLVGVVYLLFTVMMLMLIRRGDAASTCGCFGSLSSRPSIVHVAVDLAGVVVALVAAISGVRGVVDYRRDLDGAGLPQLAVVIVGCVIVVALMTGRPFRGVRGRS